MNTVEYFERELENLKKENLYRSLRVLEPQKGSATKVLCEGKEYTLFCSNDYLGLTHHPRVIETAKNTIDTCGVGSGASRLISGTTVWHERLEKKIAIFKNKEAALVYSSGFLANVGIITALADKESLIIIDKLNHASIIDACKLSGATVRVYPHKNLHKLDHLLKSAKEYNRTLIVTDSIFSMDGDWAPLKEIVQLKEHYRALLMIDEAHATGVFGKRGSGLAEELDLESQIDISMGTLSKATGVLGGYVAADQVLIDYLKNKSRPFIYTTSLPAHLCAAACEAIDIIKKEKDTREELWGLTTSVLDDLRRLGFDCGESHSPIIPVIVGDAGAALAYSRALLDEGMYVPAVRPPTVPRGKARLRITLSAAHTADDIAHLLSTIRNIKETMNGNG